MGTFEITFLPFEKTVKVEEGTEILEIARRENLPIESICGGKGKCGKCKIKIIFSEGLSPVTEQERRLISEEEIEKGYRLSCLTKVYGNTEVFVPEESIVKGFVRDKTEVKRKVELFPAVRLYPLNLPSPTLSDNLSDLDRIKKILKEKYGLSISKIDPSCFKRAPSILRKENFKVNVALWMEEELIDIKSKNVTEIFGLAFDIGTTTIGGYLINLVDGNIISSGSILNPQVKFGEDIMSRIAFVSNNKEKGVEILNKAVIEGLNTLIEKFLEKTNISKEEILEVTVVGNTVMHHLFLKIDPTFLGLSPFVPFLSSSFNLKARDLGLEINPSANIHVLPIEASFVGADNVAVILALKPYLQDENLLIIDIGTNGEIVLGNKEKLLSASCATGPAFEGAHIKFGMRADIGSIEKVRIDPSSFEVSYKVIGNTKPRGICGSGIIDAVAELFKAGIIDSSGRFRKTKDLKRLKETEKGLEFVIAFSEETALKKDITICQEDIRNVQLAKAAIYAGSKILLKERGIEKPSKVLLAGAFGMYIDIVNAYILGMFPFVEPNEILSVGNAAGEGAIFALLNRKEREEAERVARKVEYIELTLQREFQKEFLDALFLPHKKDPFPNLNNYL